ncbi:hypothetical protein EG812_17670 [Verrucosispora sp. FIM060022]|nr:hypothetical protein EG812_17670 [Verrucosispora sp. FIM060022]
MSQARYAECSAALRSTQNSLPSGSARTAQPVPSGRRWSSISTAPRPSSRSTSSSRVRSVGCRSRCTRFFAVLPSGTRWNSIPPSAISAPDSRAHSGSPGLLSGSCRMPVASAQKVAMANGSAQSKSIHRTLEVMGPISHRDQANYAAGSPGRSGSPGPRRVTGRGSPPSTRRRRRAG